MAIQCNLVSWGRKINGNYSHSKNGLITFLSKKKMSQNIEILKILLK